MSGPYLGDPWTTPTADLIERARARGAWDALDRVFVERALAAMLEGREPFAALRNALHDAATASDVPPAFVDRWSTLLDLVLRAAERPSASTSVEVLAAQGVSGRARDVFRLLAEEDEAVPLQALVNRLSLSDQRVGQLVDQLEQAGLARRIRLGRAVVVRLTPHGQRMTSILEQPASGPEPGRSATSRPPATPGVAPRTSPWPNLGPPKVAIARPAQS